MQAALRSVLMLYKLRKHSPETTWWRMRRNVALALLFLILLAVIWSDTLIYLGLSPPTPILTRSKIPKIPESLLQCVGEDHAQTCSTNYPTTHNPEINHAQSSCPSNFRWIHEDLQPWKQSGVTRDMVEQVQRKANFRLVIVDGKAYVEKYLTAILARDWFTWWGIVQLLRFYPGRLPDLELMFNCVDQPVMNTKNFPDWETNPLPLFKYCGDDCSLDIVFPDWAFWSWPEPDIKHWEAELNDIKDSNKRTKWEDRFPYAFWKGNPTVASTRMDLLRCNVSEEKDWNARVYNLDWDKETKEGLKNTQIEDQCDHRYKIYIEGFGWSVSERYILACDSMTLYIKSHFYDFFSRSMVPLEHYWPIRQNNKCTSLKFAVDWGNNHHKEAKQIGEAGSKFIEEKLKMEYVYDYMFHLLNEYAKLLRFRPVIPPGAFELCVETVACPVKERWKKFMMDGLVTAPSNRMPCSLPPPFEPQELQQFLARKDNATRQVEMWENEYWRSLYHMQ